MTDIFNTLVEDIHEPPFYIFNFLDIPENYIPNELDFSNYDSIIQQLTYPEGINTLKFIAIGIVENSEIDSILEEIESGKSFDKKKLDSYFGYDINKWGDLNNVRFIRYKFSSTQTIYTFKNILSNYLFNKLPNKFLFTKENSFLFTFNTKTMDLLDSRDTLLVQLNKKYIEGNLKYNKESAINDLSNYFFTTEILDRLSDLSINDLIVELEKEDYEIFFRLKDNYVNCGYRLQDKNFNEISSLPFPFEYFDSNLNISTSKLDSFNTNKIIRDITTNNTFYFYLLDNITLVYNETIKKPNFYRRFFPQINEKNIKENLSKEVRIEDEPTILENREGFNLVSKIEEIFSGFNDNSEIEDIDFNYLTIKHNIFFPNNYELVRLFNDLKLSYDLPFLKFKDPLIKQMVYKLYKPITQIGGTDYLPLVSREELEEWIKYSGFEVERDKISQIKSNPKELSLKIKILEYPERNNKGKKVFSNGTIRRINTGRELTYDIEKDGIIFPSISTNFLKEPDIDYNIGDTVKFCRYKVKYADCNISLKGTVSFIINLSDLEENTGEDIDRVIAKFNEVLVMIFNQESMESVRLFQKKINRNELEVKGDIQNIISKIQVSQLSKPIVYSKLYSLINILFPYLIYDEIAYKIDEEIEYFNGKNWVNAKIKEFIPTKGTNELVKLSIFDPKRGIKREIEEVVDRKWIRTKEDISYRRYLDFRYKRVSDFEAGNAIRNLIVKLNNLNTPKGVILEKVIETFGITRELALRRLADVIETEGKTLEKIRGNIGIGISIDWVDIINGRYNIIVDGIKSIGDTRYVIKLVSFMFRLYDYLFNNGSYKYFDTNKEFLEKLVKQSVEENLEERERIEKIEKDTNKGFEEDLFREVEGDVIDIFAEFEMGEEEEKPVEVDEIKDDLRKDIDREYREEVMLVEGKHSSNNVILDRLYNVDPELFKWTGSEGKSFSKMCQRLLRYPKVIDESKKIEIDYRDSENNRPSSYATIKDHKQTKESEIEEESDSKSEEDRKDNKFEQLCDLEDKKDRTKCKAIRWSSSDNSSKHWFICPRIWDVKDNVSLNLEDLTFDIPFTSENPNSVEWRTDKDTKKDITEFGPKYKGRSFIDENSQRIVPTPTKTLLFMPKGQNYTYPGFLNSNSHPKNIFVPCCFQDKSMRVMEAYSKIADIEINPSKYIQNWGKNLAPNRIGLLPPKLRKFFEIEDMSSYTTGEMSIEKKAYFRYGIQQGNEMFLALIANIADITIDTLKELIINNLTEEVFNTLNRGNLAIWFMDNSICSSYQNFLEYTLSNTEKKWEFYYDLLTRPNSWLFPNGLNLIMIDYNLRDNIEYVNIICTEFLCEKNYNSLTPIVLTLNYRNIIEPIYYFNGNTIPIKFVDTLKNKIGELGKLCRKEGEYIGYSIVNKQFAKKHNSVMGYDFTKELELEEVLKNEDFLGNLKYLISDYNKIIGIVLENNLYIPVYPSEIDYNLGKEIINIENLKDKLTLETALELYNQNEPKYNLIPLILMYRRDKKGNKLVNGFICQYGLVVPLAERKVDSSLNKVINYIEVDKGIRDYRKKLVESSYIKVGTLGDVIESIDKLIISTEDKYTYNRYLVDSEDNIVALIVECLDNDLDILVPIKSIYSRNEVAMKLKKDLKEEKEFRIESLMDYIEETGKMKRLSGYEIGVLPIRGKMNSRKRYESIILESGLEVELEEEIDILERDEDKYVISALIENYVDNSINRIEDKSNIELDSEMLRNVLKINYRKNIVESLRIQVANWINRGENREIKFLIEEIVNDIRLNNSEKARLIEVIIRYVYSILVKDTTIVSYPKVDSEIVLNSLTEAECKELGWTSYSKPNIELVEIEEKSEFEREYVERIKGLKRDIKGDKICRLLINQSYKEGFINSLVEELIRNRYRRDQILKNKNLKKSKERYMWNKNIEIVIEENDINSELISDLYKLNKEILYGKYFPIGIEIEIPKVLIDSIKVRNNIKERVEKRIKEIIIEEIGMDELNRNRVDLQERKVVKSIPISINYTNSFEELKLH